jgi:hypothetical protein
VHPIIETDPYLRAAKAVGPSPDDLMTIKSVIAENPQAGDEIEGTGGCRKLRFGKVAEAKAAACG